MEPNFFAPPQETADIDQMMAASQNGFNHRRAFSDASFRAANSFDDLLLRDFDPSDFDVFNLPLPPPQPQPVAGVAVGSVPLEEPNGSNSMPMPAELGRNLLMDSAYRHADGMVNGGERMVDRRHRYSNSAEVSLRMPFEIEPSSLVKKAMAPEKLAELAIVDPKRAKRILANRQSAAKSKERKMRYIRGLERRVMALKTRACSLSAHVSIIRGNTSNVSSQNKELRIRVNALKQQAKIRNALNEAIKKEVQILRNETEQVAAITGYPSYGGVATQISSQLSLDLCHNLPPQHLLPQQPQLYMPPPPPLPTSPLPPFPTQSFGGYYVPNYSNFNQLN